MADSYSSSSGSGGGAERANQLVLRDGGPLEAGIKGEGSSDEYKKALDPTHCVVFGGIQPQVMQSISNDDGLLNRCSLVACLPTYQSLGESTLPAMSPA